MNNIIEYLKQKQNNRIGEIENKLYKELINLRQPIESPGILNEQSGGKE